MRGLSRCTRQARPARDDADGRVAPTVGILGSIRAAVATGAIGGSAVAIGSYARVVAGNRVVAAGVISAATWRRATTDEQARDEDVPHDRAFLTPWAVIRSQNRR